MGKCYANYAQHIQHSFHQIRPIILEGVNQIVQLSLVISILKVTQNLNHTMILCKPNSVTFIRHFYPKGHTETKPNHDSV